MSRAGSVSECAAKYGFCGFDVSARTNAYGLVPAGAAEIAVEVAPGIRGGQVHACRVVAWTGCSCFRVEGCPPPRLRGASIPLAVPEDSTPTAPAPGSKPWSISQRPATLNSRYGSGSLRGSVPSCEWSSTTPDRRPATVRSRSIVWKHGCATGWPLPNRGSRPGRRVRRGHGGCEQSAVAPRPSAAAAVSIRPATTPRDSVTGESPGSAGRWWRGGLSGLSLGVSCRL